MGTSSIYRGRGVANRFLKRGSFGRLEEYRVRLPRTGQNSRNLYGFVSSLGVPLVPGVGTLPSHYFSSKRDITVKVLLGGKVGRLD